MTPLQAAPIGAFPEGGAPEWMGEVWDLAWEMRS